MIQAYIREAMRRAHYEIIDQPGTPYVGTIRGFRGVIAVGETLEHCPEQLEGALEAWIVVGLMNGHRIPTLGKLRFPRPKQTPSGAGARG